MLVLITGGAGFIGSRTALALRARGHDVRILDNLHPQIHTADPQNSPTWRLVADQFPSVIADINDRDAVSRALDGCEAVVHLAAETGTGQSMYEIERYVRTNIGGTAILLEQIMARAQTFKRVVVASSRSIYGEGAYRCPTHNVVTPQPRTTERMRAGRFEVSCPLCDGEVELIPTTEAAAVSPASVYAVTKLSQEQLVAATCTAAAVPWLALRYQNVYGPGQSLNNPYTGVLSVFSRLMLAGSPVEIFEDGKESRDFVYIDDVVAANVAAVEAPPQITGSLNVGSGVATPLEILVNQLAKNYGYSGDVRVSGRFRAGDIRHNVADVSQLAKRLGLSSRTTFSQGIAEFCRWVKEELAASTAEKSDGGYQHSLAELEARGLIN